jgi:beta-galactosidase
MSPDGRRVHILHNWSWDPVHVTAPVALSDVLEGRPTEGGSISAGKPLPLAAWGVRVLIGVDDMSAPS